MITGNPSITFSGLPYHTHSSTAQPNPTELNHRVIAVPPSLSNQMNMSEKKEEMEIDSASHGCRAGPSSTGDKSKPRFEIKKYNAVALWAWGTFCHYWFLIPVLCFNI